MCFRKYRVAVQVASGFSVQFARGRHHTGGFFTRRDIGGVPSTTWSRRSLTEGEQPALPGGDKALYGIPGK